MNQTCIKNKTTHKMNQTLFKSTQNKQNEFKKTHETTKNQTRTKNNKKRKMDPERINNQKNAK